MKKYIGVKMISAKPMTRAKASEITQQAYPTKCADQPGYLVEYPDGYQSWSPKAVFEAAYFPLEDPDGSKISHEDVDRMMGPLVGDRINPTTTLVKAEQSLIGFHAYDTSSCVDPDNYDHDTGIECGAGKIRDEFWKCLGFVLKWAMNGLEK